MSASLAPALSIMTTDPTLDVANDNTNTSSDEHPPASPARSVTISTDPTLDGPKPQPNERSEKDVVMQDATSMTLASLDPPNDNNLPPWLAQMIAYLRGVSEDLAWQDLVTAFVAFEKRGPPHGVSFLSPSLLTDTTYSLTTDRNYLRSCDLKRLPTGSKARKRMLYR